jgi:hypothetical protein
MSENTVEICALLGYYAALSGSSVPTFRDNFSVLSSRVKLPRRKPWTSWPLKMGFIGFSETLVKNFHSTGVLSQKSADFIYIAAEA